MTNNKKEFVDIRNINPIMFNKQFKYKKDLKFYIGGALVVAGLITLPIPTGSLFLIGLGGLLMTPLNLKYSLRNVFREFKFRLFKLKMRFGLI